MLFDDSSDLLSLIFWAKQPSILVVSDLQIGFPETVKYKT